MRITSKNSPRPVRNMGQHANTIRMLRVNSGLTPAQLAEQVGVTKNAVYNWEMGKSRPDFSLIAPLCEALGVSADEIIGKQAQGISANERNLLYQYRCLSSGDQKAVAELVDALIRNRQQERQDYCRRTFIPLYVAPYSMGAGLGEPLGDCVEHERMYVRMTRESSRADRVVRVNGDSMVPTYRDGELLLVQDTSKVNVGEIGVFVIAGEGYVKEYQLDGLHSHNQRYDVICPSADDETRCIGRVIGVVLDDMLPNNEEKQLLEDTYN